MVFLEFAGFVLLFVVAWLIFGAIGLRLAVILYERFGNTKFGVPRTDESVGLTIICLGPLSLLIVCFVFFFYGLMRLGGLARRLVPPRG
mgnify:CR=1